jgi:hypothetical protein
MLVRWPGALWISNQPFSFSPLLAGLAASGGFARQ